MKNLFLSFSYLLTAMAHDRVPQDALDDGLFLFSARRDLVIDMEEPSVSVQLRSMIGNEETFCAIWKEKIIPAVLRAEQDHRVLWRIEQRIPYEMFCDFLDSHNIYAPREMYDYPNLNAIRTALLELNSDLKVWIA